MNVPIDATAPSVAHRQGVPYSAAIVADDEAQPAHRRPVNGARRVEPVDQVEKTQATDDERRPAERLDETRAEASDAEDVEARPPAVGGSYDRKLSYDADVNRVYLDIVNTKNDEVLLRLPSESTARYLEQVTAQSDDKEGARPVPRIQEIA